MDPFVAQGVQKMAPGSFGGHSSIITPLHLPPQTVRKKAAAPPPAVCGVKVFDERTRLVGFGNALHGSLWHTSSGSPSKLYSFAYPDFSTRTLERTAAAGYDALYPATDTAGGIYWIEQEDVSPGDSRTTNIYFDLASPTLIYTQTGVDLMFFGLLWHPTDGLLYAIRQASAFTGDTELVSINPSTGTLTSIVTTTGGVAGWIGDSDASFSAGSVFGRARGSDIFHERVWRYRLSDGDFAYSADLARPFADRLYGPVPKPNGTVQYGTFNSAYLDDDLVEHAAGCDYVDAAGHDVKALFWAIDPDFSRSAFTDGVSVWEFV